MSKFLHAFFEARHITKRFGSFTALHNLSVHVPKGCIYGLLGPNGAGKTTFIRIINQITGPDSGEIFFDGRPFKANDVFNIGYLPEERGLYRKMKVGEQALYLAQLKGLSKKDAFKALKYWFGKFEIIDWWDKKVEELSKGMAQKIQFISTVLHDPDLLIFDEPFSGFDPVNAAMLKEEIRTLKEKGKTIILSTHDMASVEELCDNISLINKSELVLEGEVSQVKQKYKQNRFEVIFQGEKEILAKYLDNNAKIISYNLTSLGKRVIIEQTPGNASVLNAIYDKVTIELYREVLPTMNEVFINAVQPENSLIDE